MRRRGEFSNGLASPKSVALLFPLRTGEVCPVSTRASALLPTQRPLASLFRRILTNDECIKNACEKMSDSRYLLCRYVPAIFYQDVSEYGNQTTHTAEPYFPVDYLVVSVNGPTFPQQSNPTFSTVFSIENRIMSPQGPDQLRAHLNSPENKAIRPSGQLKVYLLVSAAVFECCSYDLSTRSMKYQPAHHPIPAHAKISRRLYPTFICWFTWHAINHHFFH